MNKSKNSEKIKNAKETKAAKVKFPPPLIYLAVILFGVALQKWVGEWPFEWLFALSLGQALSIDALYSVRGWMLVFFGAAAAGLIGDSLVRFIQTRQNPEPWTPSPQLITTGVYRFTRNPMYLGMALLQGFYGLYALNGWVILLLPLSMLGVYFIAIRPEETYLAGVFEKDYHRYKQSVRRWL
ncbi:methyltransferase family protein [Ostreibacterium oceani]|uniref:Isoprenylcysteine carboxylmethyltransferase family protein n=1 Tax=Ostreibacterium oceani TaxID=2654998 RepID=A0A6N7F4F4_9GAMM|nr:isoprenylcysteine carboxylmethyltransferase family protein [Ostreibacterium oceani]MPV86776.1 isoprenylcysteine carboxylmethyltransferase family protein [Ostreibacterium oceani]